MLTCSGCNSEHYNGTIFCPVCGASFLPEDQRRDAAAKPVPHTTADAKTAAILTWNGERELHATVLNNGRQVKLPLQVPILIGRADRSHGFYPDLDLNNDGGYEAGVSRRHARISISKHITYVEDLESGNGTFVNNNQVAPCTAQRLRVGDELRLGSMIIRIEAL